MKAKEYVAKYKPLFENINNEILNLHKNENLENDSVINKIIEERKDKLHELTKQLSQEYMDEMTQLVNSRKARYPDAILAIWKELNDKWNAMIRLSPELGLKENGFKYLIKIGLPNIKYLLTSDHRLYDFLKDVENF